MLPCFGMNLILNVTLSSIHICVLMIFRGLYGLSSSAGRETEAALVTDMKVKLLVCNPVEGGDKRQPHFFSHFKKFLFKYSSLHFPLTPPATPAIPHFLPLILTLLSFVHVSFIHVPEHASFFSPHFDDGFFSHIFCMAK